MGNWPQGNGNAASLRGEPISTTTPTTGQVLAFDGTKWAPSSAASGGVTQLTGDVTAGPGSGSQAATVARIQGRAVATTAPSLGQSLTWDGLQWAPATSTGGITQLTGDVTTASGSGSQAATVARIQGRAVASTAPSLGQYLGWSGSQWAPATPPDTGITQLTGDVTTASGSGSQAATVAKLQGRAVASTAPTGGQTLAWNALSSQWEPTTPSVGGSVGGDLTGTLPNPTVDGLQGRAIASTAPVAFDAYVYDGAQWSPSPVARGGAWSLSRISGAAGSLPYFDGAGAAATLAAPTSKPGKVLGWLDDGSLGWVSVAAAILLFGGGIQAVTSDYIIEAIEVVVDCPGMATFEPGLYADTATGIV